MKLKAVNYLGGKCAVCGYDSCIEALEFHHINPEEKEFAISGKFNISWEKLKSELDKCQLLCANCHRELHSSDHQQVSVEEYEKWIDTISEAESIRRQELRHKAEQVRYQAKLALDADFACRKNIVESCGIDFSQYGWAKKLSKLFGLSSAYTVRWLKKYMPSFYANNCYREKSLDDFDERLILDLYAKYRNVALVAKYVGISAGKISLFLSSRGINFKTVHSKQIDMVDKNTDCILMTFNSIMEASAYCEDNTLSFRTKNPSLKNIAKKISSCVNGRQKTAYGFKWQEHIDDKN